MAAIDSEKIPESRSTSDRSENITESGPISQLPFFPIIDNVLNFFKVNREFWKRNAVLDESVTLSSAEDEDEDHNHILKLDFVKFPGSVADVEPLKFEGESADRSVNSTLLWQVYAVGGFFVMKWVWSRWRERENKKKSPPPPPSNE